MFWVAGGYLTGFVKVYFSFHSQVRLRFNLLLGLVNLGVEMVVSPRVVH